MKQFAISFIIPCYNEELFLPGTLESIRQQVPGDISFEILVADNGSTDSTVQIARNYGAVVLVDEKATVGGLRNRAAEKAKGEVLVFLDADIELTKSWGQHIPEVCRSLIANPWQVTGSRCGVPPGAGWIGLYWFEPLVTKAGKYINSGHLITSRKLFVYLNGFDDTLETGEDYAFGIAAAAANAIITNNPMLAVVHHGYPQTIHQFVSRERWHGKGDCKSIKTVLMSKVALISILFAGLHAVLFVGIFCSACIAASLFSLILIIFICLLSAYIKKDAKTLKRLVLAGFLYYLYYTARGLSCLPVIGSDGGRVKDRS